MKRLLTLALAAIAAVGCSKPAPAPAGGGAEGGSPSGDTAVIKWTAIPSRDPDQLKQKFDPVSAYLAEKTGLKFEYVPVSDYDASVTQFKTGDVLMAWFGGLTGVQARAEVPGSRAFVQGAEDPVYKSYFIANASTGLEKSDDFPMGIGKLPFSFGSKGSTSGRLMPEYFIRKFSGKSPDEFFEEKYVFSGQHDLTAKWVAEGNKVKAGALDFKTYDGMVKRGELDPAVCKVIWVTPLYADYNFTAHPDLDKVHGAGTIDRIQKALIEMSDPKLCAAFERSRLVAASNEDFAKIEDVAKQLELVK